MMYSCAVFESPEDTLEQASLAKLQRVCEKLELAPSDHVAGDRHGLGRLPVYAAERYGCRVTTTTISSEQHAYATERCARPGLQERRDGAVSGLRDRSQIGRHGPYDKLVSIEMIEAVAGSTSRRSSGAARNLSPGRSDAAAGDRDRGRGLRGGEGGQELHEHARVPRRLPAVDGVIARTVARVNRLSSGARRGHHAHYAMTLARWRERFEAAGERLSELGYDERFRRLWERT